MKMKKPKKDQTLRGDNMVGLGLTWASFGTLLILR